MLFSIQTFSQNTDNEYSFTDKEIIRITDTTYVFFIHDNIICSESFSTKHIGIVKACKFLEYESKLSKQDINSAFNYLVKWWWDYSYEYSESIPNKNDLQPSVIKLLSSDNEYSRLIDVIIIMKYEIYNEKYTKTEKRNLFEKNARIVGMPEDKIPIKNPFSDDYDDWGDDIFFSGAYTDIRSQVEIEEIREDNAEKDKEIEEIRKDNAEKDKEIAEIREESAEIRKKTEEIRKDNAEMSIVLIKRMKENFLLDGEIDNEERKTVINCIASVNLRQHLLKGEADYTEKMKKHNENVTFLKKELNITEQEIQEEINKLEK